MTRTEERLADALDAAARAMPEEDMRPLIVPVRRQPRLAWAAPVASAAALLLVIGIAVVLAGQPGPVRINSVAAPYPYYVAADRNGGLPQVWSTTTGTVTDTLQVPHVRNLQEPALVAAAANGIFFAAVAQRAGERVYRFRLTATGQITGVNALPLQGIVLASNYWDVHAMAASPDGGWLAFAMTYAGPAACESAAESSTVSACLVPSSDALYAPSPSDNIAIVNTATGQKSAWDGEGPTIGSATAYSVPSLSWSANSQSVNFILRQCPVQGANGANACTPSEGLRGGRSAWMGQINRPSRARRARPRPLHSLDASYLQAFQALGYAPQAMLSPDGSTITAVVVPQELSLQGGSQPYTVEVEQISLVTGKRLRLLYDSDVRGIPVTANDVPDAVLSTDATGQHWLLGVTYCNAGRCGGFNGWIDHGKLVPLPPGNGAVADEAW